MPQRERTAHRLARAALELLDDVSVVGMTSSAAADRLVDLIAAAPTCHGHRTLVTNSLAQAEVLARATRRHRHATRASTVSTTVVPRLLLLGGEFDSADGGVHGSATARQLRQVRLDVAVVGVTERTSDPRAAYSSEAAATRAALLRSAGRRILMLDACDDTGLRALASIATSTDLGPSDRVLIGDPTPATLAQVLATLGGNSPSVIVVA